MFFPRKTLFTFSIGSCSDGCDPHPRICKRIGWHHLQDGSRSAFTCRFTSIRPHPHLTQSSLVPIPWDHCVPKGIISILAVAIILYPLPVLQYHLILGCMLALFKYWLIVLFGWNMPSTILRIHWWEHPTSWNQTVGTSHILAMEKKASGVWTSAERFVEAALVLVWMFWELMFLIWVLFGYVGSILVWWRIDYLVIYIYI